MPSIQRQQLDEQILLYVSHLIRPATLFFGCVIRDCVVKGFFVIFFKAGIVYEKKRGSVIDFVYSKKLCWDTQLERCGTTIRMLTRMIKALKVAMSLRTTYPIFFLSISFAISGMSWLILANAICR